MWDFEMGQTTGTRKAQPGGERAGRMRLGGNPGMRVSSRLGGWIGLRGTTQKKSNKGRMRPQ